MSSSSSPIHFLSIVDLHHKDDQFLILNRVDDPVAAFSYTVKIGFSGEFLDALGTRIVLQGFQAGDDSLLSRFGERFELTFRRRGEKDRVGHGSLEAEILQNRLQRLGAFLFRFSECCPGIGKIYPIF